jgi:hypothetical protein
MQKPSGRQTSGLSRNKQDFFALDNFFGKIMPPRRTNCLPVMNFGKKSHNPGRVSGNTSSSQGEALATKRSQKERQNVQKYDLSIKRFF